MNRSRRRAAVISWAITAGVLSGAAGLASVAPAAADPNAPGGPGTGGVASGADPHSNAVTGSSRARQQAPGTATGDSSSRRGNPGPAGARLSAQATEPAELPWPCPFIWPVRPPPMPAHVNMSNSVISGVSPVAQSVRPLAQFPASVEPKLPGFVLEQLLGRAAEGRDAVRKVPATAPRRLDRSAEPAAPPLPATPLSGAITPPEAPVPRRPETGPRPPEVGRPGYPEYLRQADFSEVAVVALPGLGGILAITALGGFLGYRQAKAGYLPRAAGTARFLQ